MRRKRMVGSRVDRWSTVMVAVAGLVVAGCASVSPYGGPFGTFGAPGLLLGSDSGGGDGGGSGGGGGTPTPAPAPGDPCSVEQSDKFIRVSMRNVATNEYIHYFVVFVAFIYDETGTSGFTNGAVCASDVSLYESNGYTTRIAAGNQLVFGNYCIEGPALIRYHESGRFRAQDGGLASAIEPASGAAETYDRFFTSAGAQVPVPNFILFHNPGTGEGAALKISRNSSNACNPDLTGTANCSQDAFYYVDENDRPLGGPVLGIGSYRRVPAEIQNTGCTLGIQDATHELATGGTAATNQFVRGGRIEYVFIRQDEEPAIPQLVWRVTNSTGSVIHEFDSRADID